MGRRAIGIHLSVVCATGVLLADPDPGSAQQGLDVPFTVWGLDDGLSSASIRAMVQDSAGLIWLGTQRGLNRFDGRAFRAFLADPSQPGGLTDDYFNALAVAPGGRLWLGTDGGLELFDPATGMARPLPLDARGVWPPRGSDSVSAVPIGGGLVPMDSLSVLAITLSDEPILTLVEVDDSSHRATPLEESDTPTEICGTGDGAIVALGEGRLVGLDGLGRRVREYPAAPDTVAALSCGDILTTVLRDGRILELEDGLWRTIGRVPGSESRPVVTRKIASIGDSLLWLATNLTGLVQVDRRTGATGALPVGGDGEIPHVDVYDILVDRTGVTWASTWNGLAAAHPLVRTMDRVRTGQELPDAPGVFAALPEEDGSVLFGLDYGGVWRYRPGVSDPERVSIPEGLASLAEASIGVWDLARDEEGTLWIATWEEGLLRWREGEAPHSVRLLDVSGRPVTDRGPVIDVFVDDRGGIWAAAYGFGLARFDPETDALQVEVPTVVDGTSFWGMAADRHGVLWLAAPFDGLYRFSLDEGSYQRFTPGNSRLPSDRLLTVTPADDGGLWLGTEGDGLVYYDPVRDSSRTWTTADGLPHDNVQAIIPDRAGNLWVSTNGGVSLFDPLEGPRFSLRQRHGLASNRFFSNSGALAPDGRVILGGEGVTIIEPEAVLTALSSAGPSSVALTRFAVLGRDTMLAAVTRSGASLAHDQNFFTFEFAVADYTDPSLNRYRYRLDPLDDRWREAGNTPVANYTSVPPGDYTFRVEARNSYGVWNDAALALPVRIRPAFWQTLWFQTLVFLSILGLVVGFFRYRYQQFEARTRLRLDIAGKLHDDIGADLSTIALKTELVRATAALDERRSRQLEAAAQLARETAHRVRETVWLVNTQYDTLPGLVAKMRDTADVMLSGHVRYDFIEPSSTPEREVGMEFRQNAHLLFKETLNNLLKHAHASHVRITVSASSGELGFEVRDDGVGFEADAPESGSGQRLMRTRAAAAHGTVKVQTAPGSGTTVTFRGRIP